MELFRISCQEATQLKESTISSLLEFNRQLKVDYAQVKHSCSSYVKLSESAVEQY